MTTCKIHFVNGKVLEIEGIVKDFKTDNIAMLTTESGVSYTVNMDKVLYIESESE